MNGYCWIATAICLAGTCVNIRRINWCFYLWAVGEVMWVIYDIGLDFYSRTILDLVGLALAILGAWVNDIRPRIDKRRMHKS